MITEDSCDAYGRYMIRVKEMHESLKIIEQCLDKLKPGPIMVSDRKIAWPADLKVGPTGWATHQSTSPKSWAARWRR
ncbi:respiratory-chain NADH dehydrogenase, 49 Kd subunit [Mycobacterium xenopi 3993]|nr:respiratory-chain NADH dehydrogenase, 49 Kd subunit [Mycobacterium xenopi 3993]